MGERRHIHVIAKPKPGDAGYMEMVIVGQTHLGADLAGDAFINEAGDEVNFREYPPNGMGSNQLCCDGGSPEFVSGNPWVLYLRGEDTDHHLRVVTLPLRDWPEVKYLIEKYNEEFKGD